MTKTLAKSTPNNIDLSAIFEWDVSNWSRALPLWETALQKANLRGIALELGARKGGLSLWLASKGFDTICSDVQSPLEIALPHHNRFELEGSITYSSVDATNIGAFEAYDIICFKSILGGLNNASGPQMGGG